MTKEPTGKLRLKWALTQVNREIFLLRSLSPLQECKIHPALHLSITAQIIDREHEQIQCDLVMSKEDISESPNSNNPRLSQNQGDFHRSHCSLRLRVIHKIVAHGVSFVQIYNPRLPSIQDPSCSGKLPLNQTASFQFFFFLQLPVHFPWC